MQTITTNQTVTTSRKTDYERLCPHCQEVNGPSIPREPAKHQRTCSRKRQAPLLDTLVKRDADILRIDLLPARGHGGGRWFPIKEVRNILYEYPDVVATVRCGAGLSVYAAHNADVTQAVFRAVYHLTQAGFKVLMFSVPGSATIL